MNGISMYRGIVRLLQDLSLRLLPLHVIHCNIGCPYRAILSLLSFGGRQDGRTRVQVMPALGTSANADVRSGGHWVRWQVAGDRGRGTAWLDGMATLSGSRVQGERTKEREVGGEEKKGGRRRKMGNISRWRKFASGWWRAGAIQSPRRCQNQPGICLGLASPVSVAVGQGDGGRWARHCRCMSRGRPCIIYRLVSVYSPGQSALADGSGSNPEGAV